MVDFPVGDNAPFDNFPITDVLDGTELIAIHNKGTYTLYMPLSSVAGFGLGSITQAYDADLAALAANSTDGLWAHTGAGAGAARTITATTNGGLAVTNGDGATGNPTLALGAYTPDRAGAVPRAITDKIYDVVSIVDFGAVADGVTDNSAALLAAITSGKAVYIPSGVYAFTGNVAFTYGAGVQSVTIYGDGADKTILTWTAAVHGLTFNFGGPLSSIHIRDLSITTTQTGTYNGLTIANGGTIPNPANTVQSDITRVNIYGANGPASTKYWGACLILTSVSNVNLIGCNFIGSSGQLGVGVLIFGTATAIAVVLNAIGCTFNYLNNGLQYGTYAQGITVTNCNFTGTNRGIYAPAAGAGLDQLAVVGCQFNCFLYAIACSSAVSDMLVTGNYILVSQASGTGIYLGAHDGFVITGNVFRGLSMTSTNGIVVSAPSGTIKGIVANNNIRYLALGVWLQSGSASTKVVDNTFDACTLAIVNAGTTNCISENLGYNPVGAAAVTPSASPYTYTAGASPETIYISAATSVTAITQGGVSILPSTLGANVNHTIHLGSNESVIITYTGTLTLIRMVH